MEETMEDKIRCITQGITEMREVARKLEKWAGELERLLKFFSAEGYKSGSDFPRNRCKELFSGQLGFTKEG